MIDNRITAEGYREVGIIAKHAIIAHKRGDMNTKRMMIDKVATGLTDNEKLFAFMHLFLNEDYLQIHNLI